jgi:predicted short-subunit dehydrogenase-like oxidoreductase (DUF2520 family)
MLHPLMEETIAKAIQDSPARMQTGPALRGDQATIDSHIRLLENHPELQQMYQSISKDIQRK